MRNTAIDLQGATEYAITQGGLIPKKIYAEQVSKVNRVGSVVITNLTDENTVIHSIYPTIEDAQKQYAHAISALDSLANNARQVGKVFERVRIDNIPYTLIIGPDKRFHTVKDHVIKSLGFFDHLKFSQSDYTLTSNNGSFKFDFEYSGDAKEALNYINNPIIPKAPLVIDAKIDGMSSLIHVFPETLVIEYTELDHVFIVGSTETVNAHTMLDDPKKVLFAYASDEGGVDVKFNSPEDAALTISVFNS